MNPNHVWIVEQHWKVDRNWKYYDWRANSSQWRLAWKLTKHFDRYWHYEL